MARSVSFAPADRPVVEVLVDGTDERLTRNLGGQVEGVAPGWYYGELRMWKQADDGSWTAQVGWSRAPGENRIDDYHSHNAQRLDVAEVVDVLNDLSAFQRIAGSVQ